MSGHCKGCGIYHEEDDDRLCGRCSEVAREVESMTDFDLGNDGAMEIDVSKLRSSIASAIRPREATIAELRAEMERLKGVAREAEKQRRIMELSIEIEDELSNRATNLLEQMHTEQWSTTECARLVIDMKKRIAADWLALGETQRLKNELTQLREDRRVLVVDEPDANGVELHKTFSDSFPWVWRKGESYWCRFRKEWRVGRDKQGEYQTLAEAFADYPKPDASGVLGRIEQ
jgi:hypothetical protein